MSTKNVHQKNRPVSQKVVVASREDILLEGMKQCIWATVNFLDISTTLQVVIMHDLCGKVQHPRQCEEQKFVVRGYVYTSHRSCIIIGCNVVDMSRKLTVAQIHCFMP